MNKKGLHTKKLIEFSADPAPQWAIDGEGQWTWSGGTHVAGNFFSYARARQYFLRGLTDERPEERAANFANMFRSLGQVIHVIQDMAQPEHSRNDIHPKPDPNFRCSLGRDQLAKFFKEPSAYEKYVEDQTTGGNLERMLQDLESAAAAKNLPAYIAPAFSLPKEYFTRAEAPSSAATRKTSLPSR